MNTMFNNTAAWQTRLLWAATAVLGAVAFAIVALNRGEAVNAAWLVVAAVCIYLIAYRFYGLFVANKALGADPTRLTPAQRHNDGLDYVPTNRYVLFGHHFAAIAGAGPLVGPVLAAQMGYLPGTLWILAGSVFAGAVQDMTVLFMSTRRDGRSLGDIVRAEMGAVAGTIAGIGILLICVIVLAVLALVVVKALIGSPWGTFAVFCTIPIALLMGIYNQFIRPGQIGEMSLIGCVLLLAALVYGRTVSETPALAAYFDFSGETLALIIIGYGFVASVLPVWLLLAPRDYLSTFLKIGTIALLAVGIIIVRPDLQMPAVTKFLDGTGPVWAGSVFPFLFITIACGAVSGWHSLISSGTTPKMFEALFILTTVDAGTRVLRFMIQDLVGNAVPAFKATTSWTNNLIGSALSVLLWGYFLYVGVIDPLGGIWTLWPLFGTANQMLAAIALTVCTVVLFKMKRERYALVTIAPATWLIVCTVTAGLEKVFSPDPNVGFISHALKYGDAIAAGQLLAPAKSMAEMTRIMVNDYVDATLAAAFVLVVIATVVYGLISIRRALGTPQATAIEIGLGAVRGGGHA
jgi:carbon starvation protein CstA